MKIAAEIQGVDEFVRKVKRAGDIRTQRRILKAVIRSGANPVKTAMRRQIRAQGAVRKGHLRKAVISKFKVYRTGVAWLAIGIRHQKLSDGENPGNYFHLVDLGTKPHTIHRRDTIRVQLNNRWYTVQGPYSHPGAQAKPIRQPALQQSAARVVPEMAKRFAALMEKEMRRAS